MLLLAAAVGVACNSQSDILKGRDGGRGGSGGGTGGSGAPRAGARRVEPPAGAAGRWGTGGLGRNTSSIVGMPLGTFDTNLDGFFINTTQSGVIAGNDAVQQNVYGSPSLPLPDLAHNPTAGSPTPGCLKLTASFTGGCCEFVEVGPPRWDPVGPTESCTRASAW